LLWLVGFIRIIRVLVLGLVELVGFLGLLGSLDLLGLLGSLDLLGLLEGQFVLFGQRFCSVSNTQGN
jgi:hypothetical protein